MSTETELQTTAAEFLGTLVLVFFAVGATVLAGEYIGTLGIALAFGFTLLALAYAFGPISGCHVNPAVTLGHAAAKRLDMHTAIRYWVAQIAGAIAGAALLFLLAKQVPGLRTSESFGSNGFGDRSAGADQPRRGLRRRAAADDPAGLRLPVHDPQGDGGGFGGLPIGLALAAVNLMGIPLTGASVNPARSLGPAIFAGGAALTQLWLFIVAPLVGGVLAAVVHRFTHPSGGRRGAPAHAALRLAPALTGPDGSEAAPRPARTRAQPKTGPVNFSPGPCPGSSGHGRSLAEGELERLQTVAQRRGVVRADLRRARGDQAGQRVDQLPRLVQVAVLLAVLGEPEVDRGGAHQVHGDRGDHLDRGHVRDVAGHAVEVGGSGVRAVGGCRSRSWAPA